MKIFEKKVKVVLELCKVNWTVINTQRRNHATEVLSCMSEDKLKEYDVIVAVGGDGTVCEVVSSIIFMSIASLLLHWECHWIDLL